MHARRTAPVPRDGGQRSAAERGLQAAGGIRSLACRSTIRSPGGSCYRQRCCSGAAGARWRRPAWWHSALLVLPVVWVCSSASSTLVRTAAPADTCTSSSPMLCRCWCAPSGSAFRSPRGSAPWRTRVADPTGRNFAHVADQIAVGVTLEEALHELAARNQLPEYRLLRHRSRAAERDRRRGQRDAGTIWPTSSASGSHCASTRARLASEARTSIYILAALPVFAGGALCGHQPGLHLVRCSSTAGGRTVFAIAVGMLTSGHRHDADHRDSEPVMSRPAAVADGLLTVCDLRDRAALSCNRQLRARRDDWRRACEACSARSASRR